MMHSSARLSCKLPATAAVASSQLPIKPAVYCPVGGWCRRVVGPLVGALGAMLAAAAAPVFPPAEGLEDNPALEEELRAIRALSDDQLAALVPAKNGLSFCGCPNCDAGTQDSQLKWLGWKDPKRVQCRFCQMIFPNDQYPENQSRSVLNPRGEPVVYRYFRDKDGANHYFSAAADYDCKGWLGRVALRLASLAHNNGDPAPARQAVRLLDAFGEKYPGWCVMSDRAYAADGPLDSYPAKPHPYNGGIWSRWYYYDIPLDLLFAYDLVRDSPEWRRLSAAKGIDTRKRLEDGVFRASVAFVREYEERMSNISPRLYHGLVVAGRVMGEPDFVHDGVDRFRRFLRSQFYFDGMWREGSVSYHRATLFGLAKVIEAARGYVDPAGYSGGPGGETFRSLDLAAEFPFFRKAVDATSALIFPNGQIVPVHDGWAFERRGATVSLATELRKAVNRPTAAEAAQPELPRTKLLSGMEHCCLHHGTGTDQLQARLHFSPGNGHKHQDLLSLILWARDRELTADLGYTHTIYRHWSRSTPAHSTVVVNESEQQTRGDRCDLTLFDRVPQLLQTVEASGPAVYPRVTKTYQRQLVMIAVGPEQAYVVDVFRVAGGERHDWFLHGSADDDQTVSTSLELTATAGTLLGPGASFRLPRNEQESGDAGGRNIAYAFIRNLAMGQTDEAWSATFRFKQESPVQLRSTVLAQPGTTVVVGEAPSIRRAREDDSKLNDFMRPVIVARRRGEDLHSAFVAVHEAHSGRPLLHSVRRVAPAGGAAGDPVALVAAYADRYDVIILSAGPEQETTVTMPGHPVIQCRGRTGLLRFRGATPVAACLLDGSYLRCGGVELKSPPSPEGAVAAVRREGQRFGFHVREKLHTDLTGRTILVTLPDKTRHGYPIQGLAPTTDGTLILLDDDPGFAIRDDGKVDFLYFPQRQLTGAVRYRISTMAQWSGGE
jgi:hypothetical protein